MMTAPAPEILTHAEAQRRYDELRSAIDDLEEFKQRGQHYELSADELIRYEKLMELEFLLGG